MTSPSQPSGRRADALSAGRNAIVADYAETGNQAETARRFGLTRERVRQIVTSAGDASHDRRSRYPEAHRRHIGELAFVEGVRPVARLARAGAENVRSWMHEFCGARPALPPGRPTREDAARRDLRIRAALSGGGSTSVHSGQLREDQ